MKPNNKDLTNYLKNYFKECSAHFGIKFAFLYGSRSVDMAKDNSDIDIAVIFNDSDLTEDIIFDRITEISCFLSGETGIDVDIIVIDMDFSRPMLFYNAIVLGTPLLITNYIEYLKLRNEAIYYMEDFKIFGLNWQRVLIEKNLGALKNA